MASNPQIKNPPGVSHGGKGEEGNNGANVSDQKMDCKGDVVLNYYQFHIGDFRSGTVNMSRHARWIYRDMLDVYYDKEGPLPLDLDELCDAIGVESDEECAIVERHLRFKFEKREDGYHNETCNRVIAEYHGKADTARTNGKLGGRPKKPKITQPVMPGLQSGSDMVSKTKPKQTKSQANQEPITINQEPLTIINSVADATDARPSKITDPKVIIFSIGVGMLVEAGISEKQSRSFLGGLVKTHGEGEVINKLRDCAREKPIQPLTWLAAALPPPRQPTNKQEALERQNQQVADEWVADMQAKMGIGVIDAD